MASFKVAVIGATGMVGQKFIQLLSNHPWFKIEVLAASSKSAGKKYVDALKDRGVFLDVPRNILDMTVYDAVSDMDKICGEVDFAFCAVNLTKDKAKQLEEDYAKRECPIISNNSANRSATDVPMIIPELNFDHAGVIPYQKRRLKTSRGFIAVKSNCSLQSYVPPLTPLIDVWGLKKVLVCTYQAVSGAGKTVKSWPEMADNVIPYIGGEEEKSVREPLKIWGKVDGGEIVNRKGIDITAQCFRVPVSDGHMAAVFASFEKKPDLNRIKQIWAEFYSEPQRLNLPFAPKQFLRYFEDPNRPQTALDRDLEHGMGIALGRLREDTQYDIKFVCLSHNTVRGAAGGAILTAELLAKQGFLG